jgi:hypothetical protein
MYEDRDFLVEDRAPRNPQPRFKFDLAEPSRRETDLVQDLDLATLFEAMAEGDSFLYEVSKRALMSSLTDPDAIRFRQEILEDCMARPDLIKEMYAIALEAVGEESRIGSWGFYSKSPSHILPDAVRALELFMRLLKRLRNIADDHAAEFHSQGLTAFFAMLQEELDDEYFRNVAGHLRRLKFPDGMLISAGLGMGNKGTGYVLRQPGPRQKQSLKERVGIGPRTSYYLDIHPRDITGARTLRDLTDRGFNRVANALGQSRDHVLRFFTTLRSELGFYVACLNLIERLANRGEPTCMPDPLPLEATTLSYRGLYDVCLALRTEDRVVGNDADAEGKSLIMITGANSGGKSTLLRGIGLAQLMMQCGMFVPAEAFSSNVCDRLFTHFIREEDTGMESGKLDEELSRMSEIADEITPHSMVLFNESFAGTNEREGSEIAGQIIRALLESGVKVFFVTHLFSLADAFYRRDGDTALFLRAERGEDGRRTFKLVEGRPLPTSFGEDIYNRLGGWGRKPDRFHLENFPA